jgi:hypothetical protein
MFQNELYLTLCTRRNTARAPNILHGHQNISLIAFSMHEHISGMLCNPPPQGSIHSELQYVCFCFWTLDRLGLFQRRCLLRRCAFRQACRSHNPLLGHMNVMRHICCRKMCLHTRCLRRICLIPCTPLPPYNPNTPQTLHCTTHPPHPSLHPPSLHLPHYTPQCHTHAGLGGGGEGRGGGRVSHTRQGEAGRSLAAGTGQGGQGRLRGGFGSALMSAIGCMSRWLLRHRISVSACRARKFSISGVSAAWES